MTTTNNSAEVVVGSNGSVWVAPAGTITDPATLEIDQVMGSDVSGFTELGYIDENGVVPNFGKTVNDIMAWQAFYAIRKTVTARTLMATFALRQWNRDNLEFALEGTVSGSTGNYTFTPNDPEELDERQLVVDWQDADKNYRLFITKGIVSEAVETHLVRTDSALLPIGFAATEPGSDDLGDPLSAWYIYTDDPAFAAVSS